MILAEKSLTNLELIIARLDDKIIQSQKFMEDDDFIKSSEFKGGSLAMIQRVKR